MNQPRIKTEITFLSASEGGRNTLPPNVSDGKYRPHLVVGDPNQRKALLVNNVAQETYLGVQFVGGPSKVVAGEPFLAELELLYWPSVTYESLVPGAKFTIREGPHVVGHGEVKSVSMNRAT
jgi:translation elongation factor EF-Tu-like GTPase